MMVAEFINGGKFIDSFMAFLPPKDQNIARSTENAVQIHGKLHQTELSDEIRLHLPEIFAPIGFGGSESWIRLFNGDLSNHDNDHSSADCALIGLCARKGLSAVDADRVMRASGLYRQKWDDIRGNTAYGQMTISFAYSGLPVSKPNVTQTEACSDRLDPELFRAQFINGGMAARQFVGPMIAKGMRLFPLEALSTLVAAGGGAKTSTLIAIGSHIAAGKDWGSLTVQRSKVIIASVEETEAELYRKFSATVSGWAQAEIKLAQENLLLISLLGQDARLTKSEFGQMIGTGWAQKISLLAQDFGMTDGLIILDHFQGLASGDMNKSETGTAMCREANSIVEATKAAVVFAAHIPKSELKATGLSQGMAAGSLTYENAMRQLAGLLPMSEEQAKQYGLETLRSEFMWLGMPKNSYGSTEGGIWLRKVYVPQYHTIRVEPVELKEPISPAKLSANERLTEKVLMYLDDNPWTTKNILDGISGLDGLFKASKSKVRDVLAGALDEGRVYLHLITAEERKEHGLAQQVKEVLRVK